MCLVLCNLEFVDIQFDLFKAVCYNDVMFSLYRWLNGQHLRLLPTEDVATMFREQWMKAGILTESVPASFVDVGGN